MPAGKLKKIFRRQLEKGVAAGEIRPDIDLQATAAYLFTLYNGLKVIAKIHPSREALLQIVATGLRVLD